MADLTAHTDELHAGHILGHIQEGAEHGHVGGVADDGSGDGAVESHILEGHMGAAVEGSGDAGVGADDGDVILAVAGGEEQLVEAAAGGEGAEGVADGLEAGSGQTAGDADHVALGDAAVDGTVALVGQLGGADAAHQVGVQVDDLLVGFQQFANGLTQDFLIKPGIGSAGIDSLHSGVLLIPWRQAGHSAQPATCRRYPWKETWSGCRRCFPHREHLRPSQSP